MTTPDPAPFAAADLLAAFGTDITAPGPPVGTDPHQHDRYTFYTADLATGRIVDEVTGVGGVQFGKQLNDTSTAACRFMFTPTRNDPYRADRLRAATLPGRTALYICDGDNICWGGPIWSRRADLAAETVDLTCADFFSYLTRLILRNPTGLATAVTDLDDNDIIRQWLAATDTTGITPDPGDAGNTTTQTNWNYEYAVLAHLIQDLASTIGGPDVYCDVVGTIDQPQRVLRLGTPRLGRPLEQSQLVFDDRSLVAFEEDASDTTTEQWTPGAGSEVDQAFAHAVSSTLLQQGFPPLAAVSTVYDKVSDPATLQGHADADLAVHAGVAVTFGSGSVTGPRPSQILPGDEALVSVRSAWLPALPGQVDRFGRPLHGVEQLTRLTGFTASVPDDGGDEPITPHFGELVMT